MVLGIAVDSAKSGTIENDTTSNDQGDGIALYGVTDMKVSTNKAKTDYNGIYIGGPGSAVASSTAQHSLPTRCRRKLLTAYTQIPTPARTPSLGHRKSDIDYSFQDFSTGSKTAGTANTWSANHCTPAGDSSPEGLC